MVIEYLTETPPCPLCYNLLRLRDMPDAGKKHWHCPVCKTEWDVLDLIEALNDNEEIAILLEIEELNGQVR